MTQTLYLEPCCAYLAERWLCEHTQNVPVQILSHASTLDLARDLCQRYPFIQSVFMLSDDLERPQSENKIITVPYPVDTIALQCFPETAMPDIAPLYPTLRRLGECGFRQFDLYGIGGTRRLSIACFLDQLRNRHTGKRCFVVGNGPSLNQIDMTLLKDEIVFGSNRCFLGFEKWGFAFPYWGVTDNLQVEEYYHEYEHNVPRDTVKFFPFHYLPLLSFSNACPVPVTMGKRPQFLADGNLVGAGYTVTYALLQIAATMGCNPIILVGVDHRYPLRESTTHARLRHLREQVVKPLRGTLLYDVIRARWKRKANTAPVFGGRTYWEASDSTQPTHFDHAYAQGERKRFILPQPLEAERDFACAEQWTAANGVQILNATPNSALDAFKRVDFDSLF